MSRLYFTDRDLGKKFPAILAAAGLNVETHNDLFRPDGSDEQWLEYCGKNGRVAITHNRRIRYVPNELAAVMQHGVALLVVIGRAALPELAGNFVSSRRSRRFSPRTSRHSLRRCIGRHPPTSRRTRWRRERSRCGIRENAVTDR